MEEEQKQDYREHLTNTINMLIDNEISVYDLDVVNKKAVKHNYILKQKVKDKIEELKKHYNTDNNIRIYTLKDSYELQATVLEELLEEDKQ